MAQVRYYAENVNHRTVQLSWICMLAPGKEYARRLSLLESVIGNLLSLVFNVGDIPSCDRCAVSGVPAAALNDQDAGFLARAGLYGAWEPDPTEP